jgi:hypothetical protein
MKYDLGFRRLGHVADAFAKAMAPTEVALASRERDRIDLRQSVGAPEVAIAEESDFVGQFGAGLFACLFGVAARSWRDTLAWCLNDTAARESRAA